MATVLFLALMGSSLISSTHGALYVTSPSGVSSCTGGKPCTIQWLDDGTAPLLPAIGPSQFALYYQEKTLAQEINPAFDVSSTRSLTFTPDSKAGPNANSYYIWITSNSAKNPNNTNDPYQSFSGRFTLDGMTGTADNPVSSDTATQPIPQSTTLSLTSNGVGGTTTLPPPPGVTPTATPSTSSSSPTSHTSSSGTPTSASSSSTSSSGPRFVLGQCATAASGMAFAVFLVVAMATL
ncbi:hypothetical protein BD410DRAFT_781933 [Rickenella mellea]|uniref:Yeast cell wall synthesis Kre9/Knh1-like N-terminal domain-containing protein n=1 Tax=Rickenella mellea TaxID=50990 RepID=A0A4Y7QK12_9AGAM|nr:hypothetical protein BD410DRAFT_781933 [Rickenella mellea]